MADSLTWYVVHTKPQSEWLVWGTLEMLGYKVLYLRYRKTIKHARKEEEVTRPFFPRYLFVGAYDWQGLYDVNNCPGVSTVLYQKIGRPFVVPTSRIDELASRGVEDEDGRPGLIEVEKPKVKREAEYAPGDAIVLTKGPFAGISGIVVLDDAKLVRVKLALFGRETEAVVQPSDLKPVSPGLAERPAPSTQASA